MKICSWNVNGLRAILRKGALVEFLNEEKPDILCLQETKAKRDQVEIDFAEYVEYWNSAERPGYSGTAIFVKNGTKVLASKDTLPEDLQKQYNLCTADAYGAPCKEGRLQTLEFSDFYLVNVYTPNSKRDLTRLDLRQKSWDPAIRAYLLGLEAGKYGHAKPVILTGDFNAAHTEIDLARPKDNLKNAGFTAEERQGITNLIESDFVDTFRQLHPDEQRYTWWSNLGHAREKNIGWRIDYFFISKSLHKQLKSAEIYDEFLGSDHCPIGIEIGEN